MPFFLIDVIYCKLDSESILLFSYQKLFFGVKCLLSFENFFYPFKGRGTVTTGRVEQGTIKVGEEVEILGLMQVHFTLSFFPLCLLLQFILHVNHP